MVAEGRFQALRDTLVHVVGEEYADTFMASLGPAEPKPQEQQQEQPESTDKREPPVQGSLS